MPRDEPAIASTHAANTRLAVVSCKSRTTILQQILHNPWPVACPKNLSKCLSNAFQNSSPSNPNVANATATIATFCGVPPHTILSACPSISLNSAGYSYSSAPTAHANMAISPGAYAFIGGIFLFIFVNASKNVNAGWPNVAALQARLQIVCGVVRGFWRMVNAAASMARKSLREGCFWTAWDQARLDTDWGEAWVIMELWRGDSAWKRCGVVWPSLEREWRVEVRVWSFLEFATKSAAVSGSLRAFARVGIGREIVAAA